MKKWLLPPTFGATFVAYSAFVYGIIDSMADPTTNYAMIPYVLGLIGAFVLVALPLLSFVYARVIRGEEKKQLFIIYNGAMTALPVIFFR